MFVSALHHLRGLIQSILIDQALRQRVLDRQQGDVVHRLRERRTNLALGILWFAQLPERRGMRVAIQNHKLNGASVTTGDINLCSLGVLEGNGTAATDVSNGGTLRPGTSAGTLNVNGACVSEPGGSLEIEIGGLTPGSGHDVLSATGAFAADGGLKATLINAFTPALGNQFTVVTASSASGLFDTFVLPVLGGGAGW